MRNYRLNKAQSLIEFILIFPIIFFLIAGFLDLGRAIFYYASISNSVREGTRYAIVHKEVIGEAAESSDYVDLKEIVKDYSFGIKETNLNVVVEVFLDDENIPEKVSIKTTYIFVPVTPGISQIFGNIPLEAQSTMRIEPIAQ